MRIMNAQIMSESVSREELFPAESTRNMAEITVFADFHEDFHWTFSLYFVVFFFHTNTLVISLFRSFVRSFVRSYFHYQVGPISTWLVSSLFRIPELDLIAGNFAF